MPKATYRLLIVISILVSSAFFTFADINQRDTLAVHFNYHQSWVEEKSVSAYDLYAQKYDIDSRTAIAIKTNNGLYLPLSRVAQISDWSFSYNAKEKSVSIKTIDSKKIQLFLNSKKCYLNGHLVKLKSPVINSSGKLYLPEDFFYSVLKFKMNRDSSVAEMMTPWRVSYSAKGNYWWHSDFLILYKVSPKSGSAIIAEKIKPRKENLPNNTYEKTVISGVKYTPKGNLIVSFRNIFYDSQDVISPFNHTDFIDLFYINTKSQAVFNMVTTLDKANGYGDIDRITLFEGEHVILPGDNGFLVIDDHSGKMIKQYALKDLLKNEQNFIWKRVDYIHFDSDKIVCRTQGPQSQRYSPLSFYIAMIDLNTGKVTWIHEALIEQERLSVYFNDDYHLLLGFESAENNQLTFKYNNIYDNVIKTIVYRTN